MTSLIDLLPIGTGVRFRGTIGEITHIVIDGDDGDEVTYDIEAPANPRPVVHHCVSPRDITGVIARPSARLTLAIERLI